jgi:hypothetical protein
MNLPRLPETNSRLYVKLLSLLVAALLSLSVTAERPGQTRLTVPVRTSRLPNGLGIVSPPPATVEVTVAGPRILLLLLPMHEIVCDIDLSAAPVGQVTCVAQQGSFELPDKELKVVRVSPPALPLTLAPISQK